MTPRSVSPVLRALFEAADLLGISGNEIARQVGSHPGTVSGWRQGSTAPRITDVECLAQVVGATISVTRLPSEPAPLAAGVLEIGAPVWKFGGRYGGPGRIVGMTEDLGDGYRLFNVAMKVEGGYGEFVHVFPSSILRAPR